MPGTNTPGSAYPGQYSGGPQAYTLTAAAGTVPIAGVDVTFLSTRIVTGGWALGSLYPGEYYGQQYHPVVLATAGGAVPIAGGAAHGFAGRGVAAAPGACLVTGAATALRRGARLPERAGAVPIAGGPVSVI